ncbi:MAG: hypothetical protein MI784_18385 [Cytophagales bacterium]|nr:hypothetical protein [Cytophagales bacterium]
MEKRKIIIAVLFMFLVNGCSLVSLYPLFTEKEVIAVEGIDGVWEGSLNVPSIKFKGGGLKKNKDVSDDKGVRWIVNRDTSSRAPVYELRQLNKHGTELSNYQMFFGKVGKHTYANFYLEETNCKFDALAKMMVIPVFTFARVDWEGETIRFRWFSEDWINKLFNENKIRLKHETAVINTVLTASPKEMQAFVKKYGDHPKAYSSDFLELKKVRGSEKN